MNALFVFLSDFSPRLAMPGLALALIFMLGACAHGSRAPASAAVPAPPTGIEQAELDALPAPPLVSPEEDAANYLGQAVETLAAFPPGSAAARSGAGFGSRSPSIHTFVLFGNGDARQAQQVRPWRHTELELLRLIDTYVTEMDAALGYGQAARHEFLIAVYDGLDTLPLIERSAPDLTDRSRQALAGRLDARDQAALAQRLRTAPGPFLVSRTKGELLPAADDAGLLLADLSAVGPEYLFPVMDAYDRPLSATGESALLELRQRLGRLALPLAVAPQGVDKQRQWVYFLDASGASLATTEQSVPGG